MVSEEEKLKYMSIATIGIFFMLIIYMVGGNATGFMAGTATDPCADLNKILEDQTRQVKTQSNTISNLNDQLTEAKQGEDDCLGQITDVNNLRIQCNEKNIDLNADLNICQKNLLSTQNLQNDCETSFSACQTQKTTCNENLNSCNIDLNNYLASYNTCQDNLDYLEEDYNSAIFERDTCQTNFSSCQDNYSACEYDLDFCNTDLNNYIISYNACQENLANAEVDINSQWNEFILDLDSIINQDLNYLDINALIAYQADLNYWMCDLNAIYC